MTKSSGLPKTVFARTSLASRSSNSSRFHQSFSLLISNQLFPLLGFSILDASRNKILKPQVVCPAGKVLESVTLVGGIQSGYFRDHGKVKDMLKCRRICCEMPHCNLAFMLSSNCFSVACKSAEACKTQSANPSRYNPKISYVREYGSNELIGRNMAELRGHFTTFFLRISRQDGW